MRHLNLLAGVFFLLAALAVAEDPKMCPTQGAQLLVGCFGSLIGAYCLAAWARHTDKGEVK